MTSSRREGLPSALSHLSLLRGVAGVAGIAGIRKQRPGEGDGNPRRPFPSRTGPAASGGAGCQGSVGAAVPRERSSPWQAATRGVSWAHVEVRC